MEIDRRPGARPVGLCTHDLSFILVAAPAISWLVGPPAVQLGWDGTAQILWNHVMVAIWVAASVSALRTPKAQFVALGWGKYWVMFWAIGLAMTVDGSYVPIGPAIWFMYWLPRLRRGRCRETAIGRTQICSLGRERAVAARLGSVHDGDPHRAARRG